MAKGLVASARFKHAKDRKIARGNFSWGHIDWKRSRVGGYSRLLKFNVTTVHLPTIGYFFGTSDGSPIVFNPSEILIEGAWQ
jgi:hypothetical protein